MPCAYSIGGFLLLDKKKEEDACPLIGSIFLHGGSNMNFSHAFIGVSVVCTLTHINTPRHCLLYIISIDLCHISIHAGDKGVHA